MALVFDAVIRSACPFLRLRRSGGRRRFHSVSCRLGLFGFLARHLAIAGQYLCGLCGSSCGRVSVVFDCFHSYFVSPAALYPLPLLPRPVAPCRLIRAHPIPSYSFHPLNCFAPIVLIDNHAPPVVSSKRGGFSKRIEFDAFTIVAAERPSRRLLAYHHAGVPYCPSAHLIISSRCASPSLLTAASIPSRCMLANGGAVAALIAPRFPPRPSCRETGRECAWMSSDAMRPIP